MNDEETVKYSGRYLNYHVTAQGWEYVTRSNCRGSVAIMAFTEDKRLVLNEQFRPPVGKRVIELPAGLAGDLPYNANEPLESAARREFEEETGYIAKKWLRLFDGPTSAGMTDEFVTLFHATGLTKVSEGGGSHGENILVHTVLLEELLPWCSERQKEGKLIDLKIFAALHLLNHSGGASGQQGRFWY